MRREHAGYLDLNVVLRGTAFLAVEADLDVRYGSRDDAACAEFSSEGFDDGTAASGRGWALGAPAVWSVKSSSIKVMTQASSPNASDFFNSLFSHVRFQGFGRNNLFRCGGRGWVRDAHGRRQDPKTPVEQALMRGLVTA